MSQHSNFFNSSNPASYTIDNSTYKYEPSQAVKDLLGKYSQKGYTHGSLASTDNTSDSGQENTSMDSLTDVELPSHQHCENPSFHHPKLRKYSYGLHNLGNTCYMNSVLQTIFNTKKLAGYFERGCHLYDGPGSLFVKRFVELLIAVFSEETSKSRLLEHLEMFKYVVDELSNQFEGYAQQDAHEFFRFIIEKLHSHLNIAPFKHSGYSEFKPKRKNLPITQLANEWKSYSLERENSIIKELFGGIQLSQVLCLHCQESSYTFEDTLDFSLDLPRQTNTHGKHHEVPLYSCFTDYTREETIDGYHCEKCHSTTSAKKRILLWKQPEILVIQFKRFTIDMYGDKIANKRPVSFPLHDLDLNPFTNSKSKEKAGKYKLYAMVFHTGELNCGHCTAAVLNEELNRWLYYNDDKVTEIDHHKITQIADHCEDPYILFYKRV